VFVSTGYGRGCALLSVQPTVAGCSVESLWTSRNLKTKFSSPVARDGFVFGLDEGRLVCLDLRDGSRRWRAGRYGHGQLLLVDDLLCVQCETGELALVAADPTAHRELARCDALADKTWNYPALAGRLLLVRNDREAICFELPGH
jgi:outer membrane protein assembly factor BamB